MAQIPVNLWSPARAMIGVRAWTDGDSEKGVNAPALCRLGGDVATLQTAQSG